MSHFIHNEIVKNHKFVYWHRHVVTQREITIALNKRITLEIDLSYDERLNKPYVGHPLNYYSDLIKQPSPSNVPFEFVVKQIYKNNLHVVFDCKDRRVFPYLRKMVEEIGTVNIAFGCFVKNWSENYPQGEKVEPHWKYENISIREVYAFRKATDTFWIGYVRGFDPAWLEKRYPTAVILKDASNSLDAIYPILKYRYLLTPQKQYLKNISDGLFLPVLHVDFALSRPNVPYIGLSEFTRNCSRID